MDRPSPELPLARARLVSRRTNSLEDAPAGAVARAVQPRGLGDWVDLPGRLTRFEIQQLYASADVYLAPAELESFGVAALEARCAGLPVIAMASGGVGEFVRPDIEGYLVRRRRPDHRRTGFRPEGGQPSGAGGVPEFLA